MTPENQMMGPVGNAADQQMQQQQTGPDPTEQKLAQFASIVMPFMSAMEQLGLSEDLNNRLKQLITEIQNEVVVGQPAPQQMSQYQ